MRFSTAVPLCLENDTRQSYCYYIRRIGNRTQAFKWYQFQWPWVTLSDLAKYSMTRSIARPLCDSWASCFISPVATACEVFVLVAYVCWDVCCIATVRDKKLSCRRLAAPRSIDRWQFCKVTQGHSRSFDVTPMSMACNVRSNWYFIATMSLSCTVSEIFNVK